MKKILSILFVAGIVVMITTACDSTTSVDVADDLIDDNQLQDATQGHVDQAADLAIQADLASIRTMLETYAADMGSYPISAKVMLNGTTDPLTSVLGSFMQQISFSGRAIYYESDGMSYTLSAELSDGSMHELTSY